MPRAHKIGKENHVTSRKRRGQSRGTIAVQGVTISSAANQVQLDTPDFLVKYINLTRFCSALRMWLGILKSVCDSHVNVKSIA